MPQHPRIEYRCSFCGKGQEQVHRLIAGPGGVYICGECIDLCRGIIAEEGAMPSPRGADEERGNALPTAEEPAVRPDGSAYPRCYICGRPIVESLLWGIYTAETRGGHTSHEFLIECHRECLLRWIPADALLPPTPS